MCRFGGKIITLVICLWSCIATGQETPDIIERKDYNKNFFLKFSVGTGNTDWRLHFPENVVDTSHRLSLPAKNKLRFKTKGPEQYIGFSALFGLTWGRFGGGFESSKMEYDSLEEEIDGQVLHFSYNKESISFNRFYLEYESNVISMDEEGKFYFIIGAMAGTYILTPVDQEIFPKNNFFVMIGPQVEHKVQRWLSVFLGTNYEFRYFSTVELFGARELTYNNYVNSFNIKLGAKFRVYRPESKRQPPPEQRVK